MEEVLLQESQIKYVKVQERFPVVEVRCGLLEKKRVVWK